MDLLHRWEGNPAITLEDIPFEANTVFNGTPMVVNGEIYLLLSAREGPFAEYETKGIEDPRVTFIDGTCYVVYTPVGQLGPRIAIAKTEDFVNYERIAIVSEPGNKDGILFPRKINGQYVRFDRPIGKGRGSIWISYSPNLIHWGNSEIVITPRGGYWDDCRIGASVPPIETPEGWLEIYHGFKMTSAGPIYRAGVVLLDLDNPSKVTMSAFPAVQ